MQYMPYGQYQTVPLKYTGPASLLENTVNVETCEFRSYFTEELFTGKAHVFVTYQYNGDTHLD